MLARLAPAPGHRPTLRPPLPANRRPAGPAVARVSAATASSHLDDFSALLAAASAGEHAALTQLFRAYQPLLLRYLRAQEPAVADDLAGDVWVSVARHLERFVGDESGFRNWLFTIARSRVTDHRRKVARRRTEPAPHERLDDVAELGVGVDPAVLVSHRLGAQDAVRRLVADLTADQAEAVLLRVLGGFDVSEVARMMDRTPGSVRVLCHRAFRHLATRYGQEVLAE